MSDTPAEDVKLLARKCGIFFRELCDAGVSEFQATELTRYYIHIQEIKREQGELPAGDRPSDPS